MLNHESPTLRYWALRDLKGGSASSSVTSRVQSEIAGWGPMVGLLSKQDPKGYWAFPEDCYWPKWSATVWNIILLGELGISPSHASVATGCEYLLNTAMSQDKSWPPKSQSGPKSYPLLWEPCVTGNMARTLAVFGYGRDPRVQLMFEFLVRTQLPDGGWNCEFGEWGVKINHSSFMSTVEPLWAFSALDRSLWPKGSKDVVDRAAEFLLVHRLYKSDRTGKVIDEEWTRLHFPLFYFYDILHGLRVLADLGYGGDERVSDALQLIKQKQLADGTWPMESTYVNALRWNYLKDPATGAWHEERRENTAIIPEIYHHLGKVGERNPWITLNVLRILKKLS
ncbi:MAG TPA: hypothetical protein VKA28_03130 [Candidatus Bathyarchaeia archaeon]|nr:hypothetical protein [Candidatus Bathyarchaeia archaeon]